MNIKNVFRERQKYRGGFWGVFALFIILVSPAFHYNCGSGGNGVGEPLEILVYPPEYFTAGTGTSLRVIVLERKTRQPMEDARVTIQLKKGKLKKGKTDPREPLFEGKTNAFGSPRITFNVPAQLEGDCFLIAAAHSQAGSGNVSIPVTVKKGFKILPTTDKNLYRPGETIHMRGLVFDKDDRAADRREVSIRVVEPSGYNVFDKKVQTYNHGIAQAGFTLGQKIKTGDYTIRFSVGNTEEEKKVHVAKGGIPPRQSPPIRKINKKDLTLRTDKSLYNRGETPVLTVLSTQQQGYVYVDLLKENRIVLTEESKLEDGKTNITLPIDNKHTGSLTCFARILVPGPKTGTDDETPLLSQRQKIDIVPAAKEKIELTFQSSKTKYFPGEEAKIEILTRLRGEPCAAGLGITILGDFGDTAPPRRELSPPVLYSNPRLITGKDGRASFNVRFGAGDAASPPVTQWRVVALAHALNGEMGSGTHNVPVNHRVIVEMAMPPQLTQHDETNIPVTIHNRQPSSQHVRLRLRKDDWFELLGQAERNTTVKPGDKKVEYFKIRAGGAGKHRVKLDSRVSSSGREDTLTRPVTVKPLGKLVHHAFNHILKAGGDVHQQLPIPGNAIKNSRKLAVKVYPGYFSQVSEGMESMLRMPHGCFEQTTSTLYPDVMVLDYLEKTGRSTPEIEEKAKRFIANGYQNLLQYETTPGGFSFYGGEPQKIPTAFGLQLFSDMAKVYPVDRALIPRIQKWLLSRMTGDHWEPDGHFGAASSARNNDFAATAYVTRALLHSGLDKNNDRIKKAVAYLQRNRKSYLDNPNALSYCALSLAKAGKDTGGILRQLNKLAKNDDSGMYWTPGPQVAGGRILSTGAVETTAIAALANLEADNRNVDISQILKFLLKNKNAHGIWGSTQATVLTLKVLKEISLNLSDDVSGNVYISMNDERVKDILIKKEDLKSKQEANLDKDLKKFTGLVSPGVRVKFDGQGDLFCQVLLSYYVPWEEPVEAIEPRRTGGAQPSSPLNLRLIYNTKRLNKGETVTVDATASYVDSGIIPFAIVDIGIPPGFEVNPGEFRTIREKGIVDRFEIDGDRVILYLNSLGQKGFRFGLKALNEGRVKMPAARIYDYYNPQVHHVAPPVELTVI